jgi:Heparinase II/III-like protein
MKRISIRSGLGSALGVGLAGALLVGGPSACGESPTAPASADTGSTGLPPRPTTAPSLIVLPEDKPRILERIEREPFQSLLAKIQQSAAREHVDLPADTFDSAEQSNGSTALAAAFLAWLFDDDAMAEKSRDFMRQLSDNYESKRDIDLDIRMADVAMGYSFALDLLRGAKMIPKQEADELERKLTTLIGAFYENYVLDAIQRLWSIQLTQNNHPIRTACSIATVAMAFPDHPDADVWANWAFSELDHLWGPTGHYVMKDGGVCEGSLYYRFAFAPSLALSLAWRNRVGEPREFQRDCTNRPNDFHWADHGCVDGTPFVFHNLIDQERFQLTSDWFFSLRMPDGQRPPIEDASPKRDNGGAIMAGILDRPDLLWDWYNDEQNTSGGMDLAIQHLAYLPDVEQLPPAPPTWRSRVMPDAGHAVFRSGWGADDIWSLLIAEHGDSRLTVHDHIDNRSVQLFAYGEYLLIDTGYYKPDMMNNAVTAQEGSHSVLMIEDEPVPPKGLIVEFGDTDAFLRNEYIGEQIAYAEAQQPIDVSTIERGVALWRNRYQIIFDRVTTPVTEPRLHTWRLHGNAGYDSGGAFTLEATDNHARWERASAGVDVYLAAADDTIALGLALGEPPFEALKPPHVHKCESEASHHAVLDGTITSVAPVFAGLAIPYRVGSTDGEGPLTVTMIEPVEPSPALTGWVVTYAGQRDLVVGRAPGAPETFTLSTGESISTDACWVATTLEGTEPLHLMARGTYLSVNGTAAFEGITEEVSFREGP